MKHARRTVSSAPWTASIRPVIVSMLYSAMAAAFTVAPVGTLLFEEYGNQLVFARYRYSDNSKGECSHKPTKDFGCQIQNPFEE